MIVADPVQDQAHGELFQSLWGGLAALNSAFPLLTASDVGAVPAWDGFAFRPSIYTTSPVTWRVSSLADLPAPVGGVITLSPSTCYQPVGMVDLGTNVLVSTGSTFTASSPADGFVTASASPLLTIASSGILVMDNITFQNTTGSAVYYDGGGSGVVLMTRVAMLGATQSVFKDGNHVKLFQCWALACAAGVAIQGTMTNLVMLASMFGPFTDPNAIGLDIQNGASIGHANLLQNGWLVNGAQKAINQNAGATVHQAKLNLNRFAGTGTYTSGFDKTSPDWIFAHNSGVLDSRSIVGSGWSSVIDVTFTNPGQGVFGTVPGTFVTGISERFTAPAGSGVFTYVGVDPVEVMVSVRVALSASGTSVQGAIGIALNGTVISDTVMASEVVAGSNGGVILSTGRLLTVSNGNTIQIKIANRTNGKNWGSLDASTVWGNIRDYGQPVSFRGGYLVSPPAPAVQSRGAEWLGRAPAPRLRLPHHSRGHPRGRLRVDSCPVDRSSGGPELADRKGPTPAR